MQLVKLMTNEIDIPANDIPHGWTLPRLWDQFFKMVKNFIRKSIKKLAYSIVVSRVSRMNLPPQEDHGHLIKRHKVDNIVGSNTMAMSKSMIGVQPVQIEKVSDLSQLHGDRS